MNLFGRLIGLVRDDVTHALANGASVRPIPVQSFPIVDDMRFVSTQRIVAEFKIWSGTF
jgi:hypothetical protein